jgi:hypothetical protein
MMIMTQIRSMMLDVWCRGCRQEKKFELELVYPDGVALDKEVSSRLWWFADNSAHQMTQFCIQEFVHLIVANNNTLPSCPSPKSQRVSLLRIYHWMESLIMIMILIMMRALPARHPTNQPSPSSGSDDPYDVC